MAARSYAWLATNGGAWSIASNWDDLTDGISPSLIVPGLSDSVTVSGQTGGAVTTLTGPGSALAAGFMNNVQLSGSDNFGSFTLGIDGSGGLLTIGAAATVTAGAATIATGSLLASGANAVLGVTGNLTLGTGQSGAGAPSCNLFATSGGRVQLAVLTLDASSAALYADGTSAIEVGATGAAHLGALTIDIGATLSGQGNANAYGAVINNGTILAAGGTLAVGILSGTGMLDIGDNAMLKLNGATGPGQSVTFTGQQSALGIATEFDQPQGSIGGFVPGDEIDLLGSPISAAIYAPAGTGIGTLTLYYGGLVADRLTLLGDYSSSVFLTASDGAGGTLITVAPSGGGAGGASGGTANPDVYLWTAASSAPWNAAANWMDVTTGASPARVAPGQNNLVTINASQSGTFTVIDGPAKAATLLVTGDVALTGTYTIGGLTIGQGLAMTAGILDLLPKSNTMAATVALQDGSLSLTGGALLAVAGAISLGGGSAGIGLPVTALSVAAGGTLTADAITLGGGSGNSITTDPTGVIEVGTTGGAATGAVTIDAGATLSGNGSVNPFGTIVDNGTVAALGGALTLGAVGGTGALTIGANAALVLNAGNALAIDLTDVGATLTVANERVALTGTITGFVAGDAIDIQNDPITGVVAAHTGSTTTLTLYYGSIQVATFALAGTYVGQRFFLVPDGSGGTDLLTDATSGGGGGGGQGNTDLLSWVQPVSGAWNRTADWYDVTKQAAATAPPGVLNQVQVVGPTGSTFQSIGGPAVCATVAFFGNTYLSGAFTTGMLAVGGMPAGSSTLTAGLVEIGTSTGLTAITAAIADGGIIVTGANATLTVSGGLTLGGGAPEAGGPDTLLQATGRAAVQLGGLALGGGDNDVVSTDGTATIEVGTLGGAMAGAITIDAGIAVAGNGEMNQAGLTIDDGTLTAQGGTLIVGTVSGTGTLSIGAAATLYLTGSEACPIQMTGAGATLLLQGSSEDPSAPISGFVQGDLIVTGSSTIGSLTYTPGAGAVGTLTLYSGADVAGTLLIAGDFSGDSFTLQPDGTGTAIGLQSGGGGASGGTTTPDQYVWTGGAAGAWNVASNWSDITAGQTHAAVAPGAHDLVTIQGGASSYTTIGGPANAASLTLLGEVALNGQYAIGGLAIGQGAATGILALGAETALQVSQAAVAGGIVVMGGSLLDTGTLTLQSGIIAASGQAAIETAFLDLAGTGDVVTVDASSLVEVGTAGSAATGEITVDQGAVLQGAGVLTAAGGIVDQGTITAAGTGAGTGASLILGPVTGAGTLLVGVGATMVLQGAAAASLLIDFAGPGTLTVAGALPDAAIAGFGDGDAIIVPVVGITSANYAVTAPNVGILTLDAGNEAVAQLTLVGVGLGQGFSVAGAAGGTIITTETNNYGGGGSTMRGGQAPSGGGQTGIISDFAFWQTLPVYVQQALASFQATAGNNSYVWSSPDGSSFGNYQPGYANFAVVTAPPASVAGSTVELPPGYEALLIQGNVPLHIDDGGGNHALLMGNAANDTITGFGGNDTLVGGAGGNSVIWASGQDTIYGGGNDSIVTNLAACNVTTSAVGRSVVFAGPASNLITLAGRDTLVAVASPGSNDTVTALGSDTVFAPGEGQLTFYGGASADVLVAFGGTVRMLGGTGFGSTLWCGNATFAQYFGGAGEAAVIGGNGDLSVQGGAGAVTVYGGSGNTIIDGSAGPSQFLVGYGASTVVAASGNLVWLVGAANDSLVASGGNATIWGANSTGDNIFQAGSGPCTISGGLGNDTFLGGQGAALIAGGGGGDSFVFTNGLSGGAVTITDFNPSNDQIDLHGFSGYSNAIVGGNEVLSLADGTTITLNNVHSMTGVIVHQG